MKITSNQLTFNEVTTMNNEGQQNNMPAIEQQKTKVRWALSRVRQGGVLTRAIAHTLHAAGINPNRVQQATPLQ